VRETGIDGRVTAIGVRETGIDGRETAIGVRETGIGDAKRRSACV
jgi:hypothetical protein